MAFGEEHGKPISDYTAGTDSGATATAAAETGKTHWITGLTAYSDDDSVVSLKDKTTVVWEGAITTANSDTLHVKFPTPIRITTGNKADAIVASSTTDCSVTLFGYTT